MSDDTPTTYHRCRHCKGFYETSFGECKWCRYETPLLAADGQPRVFPDRETCRAIQIAEYDQLPAEVKTDPMGPPPNDLTLLCNCLHCGPHGHVFEAVEMRWMTNEHMWACPCTTCGGRGFGIDIHSAENKWHCPDCGHFYLPENGDYRPSNAKCPKCGCTHADGWFDDEEYDEDEDDDAFDDDDDDEDLPPRAAAADTAPALEDDELPWDDDEEDDDDDQPEFDLGITWRESDSRPELADDGIPDDIDHPREFEDPDQRNSNDDIPF